MSNDPKKIDNNIVIAITNNELEDLVKPLIKEIFLFETRISRTTNKDEFYNNLNINDELVLIRDVNKFNENSIIVMDKNNNKLGYIPEEDNIVFSRLMDAGKLLLARVCSISSRGYYSIKINIFLKDY